MDIKQIDLAKIKRYKRNAKKHPREQVDAIANSISQFGFRQPIVIDGNMEVIVGHGRLEAAKQLGLKTVPVVMADDLTDDQVRAFRLADNKTNESEWDVGLLDSEIDSILDIDMTQFGFEVEDSAPVEIETVELRPYKKVHYLITLDINDNDRIIDIIAKLRDMEGIEVEDTLN